MSIKLNSARKPLTRVKEYSFDQLPEAVNRIETKLIEIEQLLNQIAKRTSPASDDFMNVQYAVAFERIISLPRKV